MYKHTLVFCGTLLFVTVFETLFGKMAHSDIVVVQGEKVNVRSGPDVKEKSLWEYASGFPLFVVKRQGEWVLVKDFENDTGWIHKSFLQKASQVIVKANKNGENTINIRQDPGTNSPVVAKAYYGVVFSVVERRKSWAHVRHESGVSGWVQASLLWGM